MYIYSHNRYSEGANLIRKSLGISSFHRALERGRFLRSRPMINWGAAEIKTTNGMLYVGDVINEPKKVAVAHDKLKTFQKLKDEGVSIPEWTTQKGEAAKWVEEGYTVVCRNLLNASEGRGIVMWDKALPLADVARINAPLYVKYIKKKHEYRVHVGKDPTHGGYGVLCVQQKRRKRGFENRDNQIRNHDNGWVFAVNEIDPPAADVMTQSIKAVMALGLDFGAVDVIWNEWQQKAYVLEVNTAPGLEPDGTALKAYVDYFRRFL